MISNHFLLFILNPGSGGVGAFSTSLLTSVDFYKILGMTLLMLSFFGYYFCLSQSGRPVDILLVNICIINKSKRVIYKC